MSHWASYADPLLITIDQPIAGQNLPDNRSAWHGVADMVLAGNTGTIWWKDNGPKGTDAITIEPRAFCNKGLVTITFTGTTLVARLNVAYAWFAGATVTIDGVAPSTLGLLEWADTLSSDAASYPADVELQRYTDVVVADGLTDAEHVCVININNDIDIGDIDLAKFFSIAGYKVFQKTSRLLHKTGGWICPVGDDISQNKLELTFANRSTANIYNIVVEFPAGLVDENGDALTDLMVESLKPGETIKRMVQPSFTGSEHSTDNDHPAVQYDLAVTAEYADVDGVLGPHIVGQKTAHDFGAVGFGGSLQDPVSTGSFYGILRWFFGTGSVIAVDTAGSALEFHTTGDTITLDCTNDGAYSTMALRILNDGADRFVDQPYYVDNLPVYPTVAEYYAANYATFVTFLADHTTLIDTVPKDAFPYTASGFGDGAHTIYLVTLEDKNVEFVSASWNGAFTEVTETVSFDFTASQPIPLAVENVVIDDHGATFDAPVLDAHDFGPTKLTCTLVSPPVLTEDPPGTFTRTNTSGHRTVTVTTDEPHGFGRNEIVHIRGADQSQYNQTAVVTPADTTTFTYTVPWIVLGDSPFSDLDPVVEGPGPTTTNGYTVQKDFRGFPVRKNTDLVYTEVLSRFPTFAVCYQSGYRDVLRQYDILIVDPIGAASADVLYWQGLGIEVYGYIASGEEVGFYSERYNFASSLAPFAGDGLGASGHAGYYMYTRYGTTGDTWDGTWNLPDKNGVWASFYTNPDPAFGWPQRVDDYYAPLVLDGPLTVTEEVLTFHDASFGGPRVSDTAHSPIEPDELLEIHWATVDGLGDPIVRTFLPYVDFTFDAKTGAIVMNATTNVNNPLHDFNFLSLSAVNDSHTTITYTRKGHTMAGVFWDVVDTPDVYLSHTMEFGYAFVDGYAENFITFLNNFKLNHPNAKMISNRGFTILPQIIQSCAGVMFESWLTHPTDIAHLFTTDYAKIDDAGGIAYNEGVNVELRGLRRTNIFECYSLNYCLAGEPGQALRDYCATMDLTRGYLSWTSLITLDVPAPNTPVSMVTQEGVAIPGAPLNEFAQVLTVPV